jgi:hypothetical protein
MMYSGVARTFIVALAAVVLTCCAVTMAATADDLYRAQTIVTGQGETNRLAGFAVCLEDVLIKVSGALKLAGDSRLAPYKSNAKEFVTAFDYRDQKAGRPKGDEQGTRDRSFYLTVDFDKDRIDGLLRKLGLKPWLANRPSVSVLIAMDQGSRKYVITSDAAQSLAPRESLLGAAGKRGMRVVLPDEAALAKAGIDGAELAKLSPANLAARAAGQGGDVALVGRLVWNDKALGWVTEWQMAWQGRLRRWRFRSVTFDDAFRRAIGGAAQILSGNGDPA